MTASTAASSSSGLPPPNPCLLSSLATSLLQVYVTVFADGPTRVLRFSDDKNVSSLEAQNIILDLAARLKQVRWGRLPPPLLLIAMPGPPMHCAC